MFHHDLYIASYLYRKENSFSTHFFRPLDFLIIHYKSLCWIIIFTSHITLFTYYTYTLYTYYTFY